MNQQLRNCMWCGAFDLVFIDTFCGKFLPTYVILLLLKQ